jgi:hypothetical protein
MKGMNGLDEMSELNEREREGQRARERVRASDDCVTIRGENESPG